MRNAPEVVERVWARLADLASSACSGRTRAAACDDHIPLQQAGLRIIDVIDCSTKLSRPAYHADTPDKVSPPPPPPPPPPRPPPPPPPPRPPPPPPPPQSLRDDASRSALARWFHKTRCLVPYLCLSVGGTTRHLRLPSGERTASPAASSITGQVLTIYNTTPSYLLDGG